MKQSCRKTPARKVWLVSPLNLFKKSQLPVLYGRMKHLFIVFLRRFFFRCRFFGRFFGRFFRLFFFVWPNVEVATASCRVVFFGVECWLVVETAILVIGVCNWVLSFVLAWIVVHWVFESNNAGIARSACVRVAATAATAAADSNDNDEDEDKTTGTGKDWDDWKGSRELGSGGGGEFTVLLVLHFNHCLEHSDGLVGVVKRLVEHREFLFSAVVVVERILVSTERSGGGGSCFGFLNHER